MVFKKGHTPETAPNPKGGKMDAPMSPGEQAQVDQFYDRNRDRMDKGNPNLPENRERIDREKTYRK